MRQVLEVGFSAGDRIGNYRVERELGRTGSGLLVQAHHLVLPRKAILKVVHPAFAETRLFVLQTLREACILEAIAHPGVPVVYESGVLKDRRPWFAFEPIGGTTLEDLLIAPLPVGSVAALVRDLADILDHAHRRGVVHRGLRPYRVVITRERRYPLCIPDWSEAMAHDATAHLPVPALPVSEDSGTYVAPELALQDADGAAELVDDRVDMFALGVIAYRALTGALPLIPVRDAMPQIATCELRPDAPRELVAIIESLLAVDRFDRPSASEVRAGIDWLFDILPALSPAAASRPMPVPAEPASVMAPALRLRKPRWTPDLGYFETTTDVDIAASEDDAPDS
jgi:serine/threonine-protein kinase